MKKYICITLLFTNSIFSSQTNILEKKSQNLEIENSSRTFRTGDYGLVCQN